MMARAIIMSVVLSTILTALSGVSYGQKSGEEAFKAGQDLFSKQMYEESIAKYTEAIEADPDYLEAYYNRALVEGYVGYFDRAVADFTRILALDPKRADAIYNRAVAYYRMGEYDKSWADVGACEAMGFRPGTDFLKALRTSSGSQKR